MMSDVNENKLKAQQNYLDRSLGKLLIVLAFTLIVIMVCYASFAFMSNNYGLAIGIFAPGIVFFILSTSTAFFLKSQKK